MNLWILGFLAVTTLTGIFCVPAPDPNAEGFRKKILELPKKSLNFTGNLAPSIRIGGFELKANLGVGVSKSKNAIIPDFMQPQNPNNPPYQLPPGYPYAAQPYGVPPAGPSYGIPPGYQYGGYPNGIPGYPVPPGNMYSQRY